VPTPTRTHADGGAEHDPDELWTSTAGILRTLIDRTGRDDVDAIGVASMAEAGCLVDLRTLRPRTPILAWYDTRSTAQADRIAAGDVEALFSRTGLYPSYKHGLSKLLWLRDKDRRLLEGAAWLSVADWIVLCLTGRMVTDPTLAVRTYVYNLLLASWDTDLQREFDVSSSLFPCVLPSGAPAGGVTQHAGSATGVRPGTPVAVSGHDHICTLLAAGVLAPGPVLDSVGTAESVMGVVGRLELGRRELDSGLSFVPHVLPNRYCWLGGISSAGGSVEWLRAQFGLSGSYEDTIQLLGEAGSEPTEILYFPYLAGSGAPWPDQSVRAAFVGINAGHTRASLLKAVLEGICYDVDSIRRAAGALTGIQTQDLYVVGGGARNPAWVQIKADVTGCTCHIPDLPEATALGAALAAGLGAGVLQSRDDIDAVAARARQAGMSVLSDPERHACYQALLEDGYLPLQGPLRTFAARRRSRSGQTPASSG
jgi:xylulokinase